MPFVFSKEQLSGIKPVNPGIYYVKFETFKPKLSKNPNKQGKYTINYNAWCYITQHPTIEEHKQLVIANLNESIPQFIQDFHHSFGVPLEEVVDPATGELGGKIPGIFDADPSIYKEEDPTTWRYAGPLTDQIATWELDVDTYNGREQQVIRRFICSIPDCNIQWPDIQHATDMAKKK